MPALRFLGWRFECMPVVVPPAVEIVLSELGVAVFAALFVGSFLVAADAVDWQPSYYLKC